MNQKNIFFYALSAATLLLWSACTVKHADDEIAMPCFGDQCENQTSDDDRVLSVAEQEMLENYYILSVYFIDSKKKLDDINLYIGQGEKAGFSPEYYEYPDIYYMYSMMGDDYTLYFGPYYASKYDFSSSTDPIYNLGVSRESINSKVFITQVFQDGPGDKAGLKAGDTILSVGTTEPGDVGAFDRLTSGKDGDEIKLRILREADTLDISAQLFCYLEPTVFASFKDSIPVIKITSFETNSATNCADANDQNSDKGTKHEVQSILSKTSGPTVIDLRGNPGGSIPECIGAAEQFLSKGDSIVILESTAVAPDSVSQMIITERFVATEDGVGKGRYFVFLADSATASCSEILLAGVTQNLKSPIVGQQTYGKGIGQYYIPTYAGGYSIVTSLRISDKDFVTYHDKGFLPDYDISDSLKALEKAVEIAKLGKEKRTKGYGTKDQGHFKNALAKKAGSKNALPRGGAYKIIKNPLIK